MRIISHRNLVEFWEIHPDVEKQQRAWYSEAKKAYWNSPAEIKAVDSTESVLSNNRVVFNVKVTIWTAVEWTGAI